MYKIQTMNKISLSGLELFPRDRYEIASEIVNPDAILVRSASLHELRLPGSLKAVARAGAGVNNIPLPHCSEKGIMVFNTPGANANGVKELVIAGMLLASRRLFPGIGWAKALVGKGDEVPALIEKGKKEFAGPEIKGKNLGIVGLGAIGVMVANDAEALGMRVRGYDPFISVEAAWGLSRTVKRAAGLETLLADSEYITLHAPLNDSTRGLLNREKFAVMKKGTRLLNFARGGLVNNSDLLWALDQGIVSVYVTDFPDEELLNHDRVIGIPHLGASTPESEDNCALMAVRQVMEYLENGNLRNCVNFPDCEMARSTSSRIVIANRNVPKMVGQFTLMLADEKINIADMINRHKNDLAYNIVDIDGDITGEVLDKIRAIDGVIMARRV